jgi:hypothetical protein
MLCSSDRAENRLEIESGICHLPNWESVGESSAWANHRMVFRLLKATPGLSLINLCSQLPSVRMMNCCFSDV